jgi:hypothetical protein
VLILGVKALYAVAGISVSFITPLFSPEETDFQVLNGTRIDPRIEKLKEFLCCFLHRCFCIHRNDTGVGLSGDLKNPAKAIPLGTTRKH